MGKRRFYTEKHEKTILQVTDYQNGVRRIVLFHPKTFKPIFDEKVHCSNKEWNGFLAHYKNLMWNRQDFSYEEIAYMTAFYFDYHGLNIDYRTKTKTRDFCSCDKDGIASQPSCDPAANTSLHDKIKTLDWFKEEGGVLYIELIKKYCSKPLDTVLGFPLKEDNFPIDSEEREWISLAQASELLVVTKKTLENYRKEGIKFERKKAGIDSQEHRWRIGSQGASEYLLGEKDRPPHREPIDM